MSQSLAIHSGLHVTRKNTHGTFLFRFQKNIKLETLAALSGTWFLGKILIISFIALGIFLRGYITAVLDEHEIVKKVLSPVLLTIVTYYTGTYLTLFPWYFVLMLLFIPKKVRYPILGLSAFLSLFIVFLV